VIAEIKGKKPKRPKGWLDKFDNSLQRFVDKSIREKILAGSERLTMSSSPKKKADWVKGAMERLDGNTDDEETKRQIMLACSCVFPKTRIKRLRQLFERTGSIDALVKYMQEDRSCHGLSYYEYLKKEGNTILVTKIPFNPKAYEEAKDEEEKRLNYCHCKWIKAETKSISPTFCICGLGWYKALWEGVLQKPVHVEVLRSLVRGDDLCEFSVYLPTE